MYENRELLLELTEVTTTRIVATVIVAPLVVDMLYEHTVQGYSTVAYAPGFAAGSIPIDYIKRNYHSSIITQLQQFLLLCYVEPFLLQTLRKSGITLLGNPRLVSAQFAHDNAAQFRFEALILPCQVSNQWRHTNFRAPVRKNYRDLDNQVATFLSDELSSHHAQSAALTICAEDWINFKLLPSAFTKLQSLAANFWLKIGNEDPDQEAHKLFTNQPINANIVTQARFLQDYFRAFHETQYTFDLAIMQHIPHAKFCFDSFKRHFRLRSDRDVHRKLIEIFSYRNDISQRRETAEAALKLIVKQHPFHVPAELIAEERNKILAIVSHNPDYYVYKAQADFEEKITLLAQKQLKETALIDALAHAERIEVTALDIASYLNLLKRARTKEFVHFNLPNTRHNEREIPLTHESLYRTCLREKTLNYIIHTLTRSSA